jgi:hypothetical protein
LTRSLLVEGNKEFHVEHRETTDTMGPHNLVTYVEPLKTYLPAEEMLKLESEQALAENAVWFFLENPSWREKDRQFVRKLYERHGKGMFIWKYYCAARCYLGGYKALSAHLLLRKLR